MTRLAWAAARLSVALTLALALPDGAAGQGAPAGTRPFEPIQLAQSAAPQGVGFCREVNCPCPAGLTRTAIGCINCSTYNAACPAGTPGGFGGGTGQAQGAVDAIGAISGGTRSNTGSNVARDETTRAPDRPPPDPRAQGAVDAISALGGGRTAGAETGAPQGSNVGRNQNTRTPEQDYAVKTNPYFFEDKSKYR